MPDRHKLQIGDRVNVHVPLTGGGEDTYSGTVRCLHEESSCLCIDRDDGKRGWGCNDAFHFWFQYRGGTVKKIDSIMANKWDVCVGDRVETNGNSVDADKRLYTGTVRCTHEEKICIVRDDGLRGGGCDSSWQISTRNEKAVLKKIKSDFITNTMSSLKEKFILALTKEPQKSFRVAGITNGDDLLTEEGEKIFLSWLLHSVHADAFKKDVVDGILKEEKKEK